MGQSLPLLNILEFALETAASLIARFVPPRTDGQRKFASEHKGELAEIT